MGGIERLIQAFEDSKGSRFRVFFGPGINDVYLNRRGQELKFEHALYETLVELGFERIVFFSPHRSLFFYDEKSLHLSSIVTPSERAFIETGPLSDYQAFRGVKRKKYREGMGDIHAIRILDALIRDEKGPRTSIIFLQAETGLKHFDDPRLLAGIVGEWMSLGSKNPLTVLFTFVVDEYKNLEIVSREQPIPELRRVIRREKEGLSCITFPGKDEINRAIQMLRQNGIEIKEKEKLTELIEQEGRPLRFWLEEFTKIQFNKKILDLDTACALGWFIAVKDPHKKALEKLTDLIGLTDIKKRIMELVDWAKYRKQKEMSPDDFPSLHMVFFGNPGTGKTTVARLIGEIYHEIGWLKRGHLVEVHGKDLIADYVGGTAIKTNDVITRALDGVLFIDEAYSLSSDDRGGYGQEALETLLLRMETERERLVVICAGYPDKMEKFLRSNPGLARRFPAENILHFPDFSEEELKIILFSYFQNRNLTIDEKSKYVFESLVHEMVKRRDENFGNAGEMRNLVDAIERLHAHRILSQGLPLDTHVCEKDIPESYKTYLPIMAFKYIDRSWQRELEKLVGLENVKSELIGLSKRLEFEILRYKTTAIRNGRPQIRHFVFIGNPGTGKTTVARIIGKMYKNLGLLNRGHLVEVSRADLIAGYIGQTALKTQEVIHQALDGVLFIDEAYSLETGSDIDYGKEAIQELVKAMEDFRERLVVVAAGYRKEMLKFLESNPGIASRFGEPVFFPDFSSSELWAILKNFITEEQYSYTEGFRSKASSYLEWLKLRDGDKFGNGRSVRELFEKIKTRAAERVLSLIQEQGVPPSPELFQELTSDDVPDPVYMLAVDPLATTKAIARS